MMIFKAVLFWKFLVQISGVDASINGRGNEAEVPLALDHSWEAQHFIKMNGHLELEEDSNNELVARREKPLMETRVKREDLTSLNDSGSGDNECTRKVDLGFLLDTSGSVGAFNFDKMKSFLKDFTVFFKISPNYTRVSVIKYGSRVTIEFLFSKQFDSQQDLDSAIDGILYTGGGTNTGGALSKAYTDMFNVSYGARPSDAIKLLILLTDGESFSRVNEPAERLKNIGVRIFSVGISSDRLSIPQLRTMASSPVDDHVFMLTNFTDFSNLAGNMTSTTCKGICETDFPNCDPNAKCFSVITNWRNYTCTCNVGFSGDGTICENINECELDNKPCSPNAQCNDTIGSFVCTCGETFYGDGKVCTEISCDFSSKDVYTKPGNRAVLVCTLNQRVQWKKDGKIISNSRKTQMFQNVLVIDSTDDEDYGEYFCELRNYKGKGINMSLIKINENGSENGEDDSINVLIPFIIVLVLLVIALVVIIYLLLRSRPKSTTTIEHESARNEYGKSNAMFMCEMPPSGETEEENYTPLDDYRGEEPVYQGLDGAQNV